jgi:hypothetical protein
MALDSIVVRDPHAFLEGAQAELRRDLEGSAAWSPSNNVLQSRHRAALEEMRLALEIGLVDHSVAVSELSRM